jgi:hypothetical protein
MIAHIEVAEDYLPLETIKSIKELGIDIKVCEENDYTVWSARSSDCYTSDMSDSEKRKAIYEYAIKTNMHKYYIPSKSPIIIDINDLVEAIPNLKFKVLNTFKQNPNRVDSAGHALFEIINKLKDKLTTFDFSPELFNKKCQVHIGGSHLLLINKLRLEEDCCTDHLQEMLDKGWRIVSVNHQEARRSDYVLGKYDPADD